LLDRQRGWPGLAASLTDGPSPAVVEAVLTAAMRVAGKGDRAEGFRDAVVRVVDAYPDRAWTVQGLAVALRLTPGHASARFRRECGVSLKQWLDQRRGAHAAQALAASDLGVADIAFSCGFSDQFAFSRFFRRVCGECPRAFRTRLATEQRVSP
jgi:transcriptional regulator GlxA family with amidase domain